MSDDLIERLRAGVPCCDPDAGNGEGSYYVEDANDTMSEAADALQAQADRVKALEEGLVDAAASLNAAISLLERGGKAAKKAAPSDRMFDQMIVDYNTSLNRARSLMENTK